MRKPALLLLCLLCSAVRAQEFDFEDGLDFRSQDGNVRLNVGGRLHLDAAYFDDDNTELSDSSEFRRARLGAVLTLFRDFELDYTYEFTGDGRVLDASFTYTGLDPWEFRIGQFREPFSLDELTSSNYITFMERALPNEFVRGYNSGAALYTHGENWSAAGGVFGDRIVKDIFGSGDEDRSVTGRFTFAPFHDETKVTHFGLSASVREVDDGNRVRFATDPESSIADENLVSTGSISNVDQFYVGGIEVASVKGPFSLQGEYIFTRLDRENDRADLDFNGWYVFASWFLTGESRNY
ncbi:MAG: OprO/OprP family phosphate-selective porin, partial [Burkholderiales bacterium]